MFGFVNVFIEPQDAIGDATQLEMFVISFQHLLVSQFSTQSEQPVFYIVWTVTPQQNGIIFFEICLLSYGCSDKKQIFYKSAQYEKV